MHFIQKNIFTDRTYQMLIDTVKRFDIPHQIVEIIPFTKNILFEPIETKNVFCWGSVKMAHIANHYGWHPGSFWNDNHDYRVYAEYYKDELMNYDSKILKFGDEFEAPGYLFFARPCEDTKTFTGQVFTKESWTDFVKQHLNNGHTTNLNKDTPIQICKIKDIQREIRTWVIKGKIITASKYRLNERTIYQECSEPYILDYAQSIVDLYQPADAFVLDIAMIKDQLKVVEINCINCAGFYDADIQKLLLSINDNYIKE